MEEYGTGDRVLVREMSWIFGDAVVVEVIGNKATVRFTCGTAVVPVTDLKLIG